MTNTTGVSQFCQQFTDHVHGPAWSRDLTTLAAPVTTSDICKSSLDKTRRLKNLVELSR